MANKQKLIEKAREHLEAGEEILVSVYGQYETKILGETTVISGVALATNKRLAMFASGLFNTRFEVFPYEQITSLESGKDFVGKRVGFSVASNSFVIKWIKDEDFEKFVEVVREKIGKKPQADIPEQIKKLAELKEAGVLSEEEFAKKKSELLAKM